ncbi:MAG: CRISPR-associated protein [bacterium]
MLLNLSNHAANKWSAEQLHAAEQRFGAVHDVPFPVIDPKADLETITELAHDYVRKCHDILNDAAIRNPQSAIEKSAIHVMGEMAFVYQFVKLATAAGLRCVASTTERLAVDHPDGSKTSEFRFVRFREYEKSD